MYSFDLESYNVLSFSDGHKRSLPEEDHHRTVTDGERKDEAGEYIEGAGINGLVMNWGETDVMLVSALKSYYKQCVVL